MLSQKKKTRKLELTFAFQCPYEKLKQLILIFPRMFKRYNQFYSLHEAKKTSILRRSARTFYIQSMHRYFLTTVSYWLQDDRFLSYIFLMSGLKAYLSFGKGICCENIYFQYHISAGRSFILTTKIYANSFSRTIGETVV